MINLSTSTAAHAYACRTGGTGLVVVSNASNPRGYDRHIAGTGNGVVLGDVATADGLGLLGPGYSAGIDGFRNNRFQYQIPTVGQHYGNAFHLAEDDEDVTGVILEHQYHAAEGSDLKEEHVHDEDDEEDMELSTAVEVISIDPDCDYDTDEEDVEDDEDEFENDEETEDCENEDVGFNQQVFTAALSDPVEHIAHNVTLSHEVIHCAGDAVSADEEGGDVRCEVESLPRSRSRSSCHGTVSSSSSSRASSASSASSGIGSGGNNISQSNLVAHWHEQQDGKEALLHHYSHHSDDDDEPEAEFNPTKDTLWELPAQLLQESPSPKKPHGRRKRRSASQRQSFSMPHSPIGAGSAGGVEGAVVGGSMTASLSFDDLDSLVCDLSPSKVLSIAKGTNEPLGEDLLADELGNTANFDLTTYITGEDSGTSCDVEGDGLKGGHSVNGTGSSEQPVVPARKIPKSRGKELKVLRQLMLPQEQANHVPSDREQSANGKRSCTAKVVRRLTMDDDSSEAEEDGPLSTDRVPSDEPRAESGGFRKGTKRKAEDDMEKDPTWNPSSGGLGGSRTKSETKSSVPKPQSGPSVTNPSAVTSSKPHGTSGEDNEKVPPKASAIVKGVKFGPVIKKEPSVTSSAVTLTHKASARKTSPSKAMARDHQARTNVHRKKTNVKLDHDYCSPKRGSLGQAGTAGPCAGPVGAPAGGQQRKTIEIPFLLPTKEQLRQERKLQKDRRRTTDHPPGKRPPETPGSVGAGAADNSKDKQSQQPHRGCGTATTVSTVSAAKKIAPARPEADHSSSTVDDKRTDVDKPLVNKVCGSGDSVGANEIRQSSTSTTPEVRPCSLANGPVPGGGVAVKRQVSLLKINQPGAAIQPKPAEGASGHVSGNDPRRTAEAVENGGKDSTPHGDASAVVRKKLNLQEYKKRREQPESGVQQGPSDGHRHRPEVGSGDSKVNSASGYRFSAGPPPSNAVVTTAKPEAEPATTAKAKAKESKPTATEPLDPISAAKMKALRMQQLKKEAAIKSTEAKLSQKTIPLMPIVPLAEITSLEFDEHGNPLPLDEARLRAEVAADGRNPLKLHPDYEEIIIVSIGCNTALTIEPTVQEPPGGSAAEDAKNSAQQQLQQKRMQPQSVPGPVPVPSGPGSSGASLLVNISDTIKRCCPSVNAMPGSSLIASIQQVVNKKSNVGTQAVDVVASVAESAATPKADSAAAPYRSYQPHQSSPYVGVSPPSSFSPGKPERAQTTAQHVPPRHGGPQPGLPAKAPDASTDVSSTAVEHGEDKVIMHLRKDRARTQHVETGTQTDASVRFPPLSKLTPRRPTPVDTREQDNPQERAPTSDPNGNRTAGGRQRERKRSYRSRRRRTESESPPSDADSDASEWGAGRGSKARQGRRTARRDRPSRSRSRHRSSRRHSSCSSRSRSRSRSRHSRVQQQQHQPVHAGSGRYSRSRRKSRSRSRSSSMSSSRYGSWGRRSLSSSSSSSSMSSSASSKGGEFARRSTARSRSPRSPFRSRSRSGLRSATPDHRYHSRERLNQHRTISPERKIVYVGRLENSLRKEDLQQKFQPYGKIVKVTVHLKANGSRYGFVTFEKPQHAYDAIDARGTDPNLRNYDISFGGRRAFCRTQYADLDGELSNDQDLPLPYVGLDGAVLLPARAPMTYGTVPPTLCHKDPITTGGGAGGGASGGSFDDLLKQFKKEIGALKKT